MKTAISVPNALFADADRLAKRMRWSRSRLYTEALARFVKAESQDELTADLNRVYAQENSGLPKDVKAARNRVLAADKW